MEKFGDSEEDEHRRVVAVEMREGRRQAGERGGVARERDAEEPGKGGCESGRNAQDASAYGHVDSTAPPTGPCVSSFNMSP